MKRVEILWDDANGVLKEWTDLDTITDDDLKLAPCHTCGYLFRDLPDAFVLVLNLSPDQVGDGIVIPKRMVREVRHLEEAAQ